MEDQFNMSDGRRVALILKDLNIYEGPVLRFRLFDKMFDVCSKA